MSKVNCQKSNVIVALSGGVDSSVAAYLLQKQGYAVTSVFMRSYNVDGCEEKDAEDARRVAEHLNIPFYVFDFEEEYKKRVVEYMIDGYKKGITPNPDIVCNKEIKFDLFLREALVMGADYIATGHYVRLRRKSQITNHKSQTNSKFQIQNSKQKNLEFGACILEIAKDEQKDQSYFLWTLTQEQLKYCLFPIGNYIKPEVRNIAKKAGLPTWNKKDSQGVCFLGKVTIDEFLKQYIPSKKGEIKNEKGNTIGTHDGAWYYTIGQRHGLDLRSKNKELGIKGAHETKPHYVAAKDIKTNTIVVAESNAPTLYKKELTLTNLNFISPEHPDILKDVRMSEMKILARVRYRQPLQPATLTNKPTDQQTHKLTFAEPQKSVAPGQSAVFYSKNGEMLGGAIIKE